MMDARQEVQKARECLERAEARLKACDRIRVPDGIEFQDECNWDFGRGLRFNDDKQVLCYTAECETWGVGAVGNRSASNTPLYLTLCSRSDLKAGDWAVGYRRETIPDYDIKDLWRYKLILSPGTHASIEHSTNIAVTRVQYTHWFKVVE